VTASVSADLVEPSPERPEEGTLLFSVDFSPMASPFFEPNRPSPKSIEVARMVERCVKDAGALDTETLCVLAGVKVWAIRVDIRVSNYEGNMTDCCALAAIAALRAFRRPDVTVVGSTVTIHPPADQQPVPLALHHTPITNTFAVFEEANVIVHDPSLMEDLTCDATITVAMNTAKEVCALQKSGGYAVTKAQLNECLNVAFKRTVDVSARLEEVLEALKKKSAHKVFADGVKPPAPLGK